MNGREGGGGGVFQRIQGRNKGIIESVLTFKGAIVIILIRTAHGSFSVEALAIKK
jgi:hypothetical protein